MPVDDAEARYDAFPYDSAPVTPSHPDHLATLGRLFGLAPPPIGACRVLELGCGSGMNLLPMALELSGSTFHGIDISGAQVTIGRAAIAELGLDNITLAQGDVCDVSGLGPADFIICHGVWSWVPDRVRAALLDVVRDCLAPHGIAFLSFNTLPGWHALATLRDILVRALRHELPPAERVAHARRLMSVLAGSLDHYDSDIAGSLRPELERARKRTDAYLLHEYLAPINTGEFFGDVVRRAARHGLAYLAHAIPDTMVSQNFPVEVCAEAARTEDPITAQEVLDFALGRRFTSLLLARADAPISRDIQLDRLDELHFASAFDPAPEGMPTIESAAGLSMTLSGVAASAAEVLHAASPCALTVPELAARAGTDDLDALRAHLMRLYFAGAVRAHSRSPPFVNAVSPRPVASRLCRWQLLRGQHVTDQLHRTTWVTDAEAAVLRRLDGTTTLAELSREEVDLLPSLAERALLVS